MEIKLKPKKLDHNDFIQIVKNAPLVSIDLIVKNNQNQVLLGLRKNPPAVNKWFMPGGRIFKDEHLNDALTRVVRDELGVKLSELPHEVIQFFGVYEHFYEENFAQEPGFGTHYVVLAYQFKLNIKTKNPPKTQHRQYKWFAVEDLLKSDDVHPNAKQFFKSPHVPSDSGLYSALMSHYLHYDRQMWSRTQILLAIEGAALIGGYNLRSNYLGPLIMLFATLLVLGIWNLIIRDEQCRDVNIETMDDIANKIGSRSQHHRWISLRSKAKLWILRGHWVVNIFIFLLILVNLGLGLVYLIWQDIPW